MDLWCIGDAEDGVSHEAKDEDEGEDDPSDGRRYEFCFVYTKPFINVFIDLMDGFFDGGWYDVVGIFGGCICFVNVIYIAYIVVGIKCVVYEFLNEESLVFYFLKAQRLGIGLRI